MGYTEEQREMNNTHFISKLLELTVKRYGKFDMGLVSQETDISVVRLFILLHNEGTPSYDELEIFAQLFDVPVSCFDVSDKLIEKLRKKYYRKYVRSHKVAERYRSNTNLNEHGQRTKGLFELREAVYEDILGDLQQL